MTVSYPISYPVSYPISYPVGNANLGGTRPSWVQPGAVIDEDFAGQRAWPRPFDAELVDTRASDQYVTTAGGVLVKKSPGILSICDAGMLVEPSGTNSELSSGALANATYFTANSCSVTGGQADPAGGTAASQWNELTASATTHTLVSSASNVTGFVSGTTYTQSDYYKAQTMTVIQMTFGITSHSGAPYANFDLSAGTIASAGGTGGTPGIKNLGNGLYRCWLSAAATATVSAGQWGAIGILNGASLRSPSYTGTGRTLLAAFPQMEVGVSPTSYIPTTTAAATRAANAITIQRIGIGRVVFTFDDDSQQTVSGINTAAQYTIPANLNRPLIKRMTGYAA